MIDVVILELKKQENLGSIARIMKNFSFGNLILIDPKCKIGIKAKKVAKHANDVLKKAKIKNFSHLKKYDYLIGTTAILGTDYNIPRNAITIEQLSSKILTTINKKANNKDSNKKNNDYDKNIFPNDLKIGLLIGREDIGLKNDEVDMCDILVTIPASRKYPTLNISHALAIILYEIYKEKGIERSNSSIKLATKKDKEIILKYFNKVFSKMDFRTKEKKDTQKKVWKRVMGKALLTKREAFAVMGFLRKLVRQK